MNQRQFNLTEQHINLLRSARISWTVIEFGAPGIDPKRPYGNSDVIKDICEILGISLPEDENGEPFVSEETYSHCMRLHTDLAAALEIVLQTRSFAPGTYVHNDGGWAIAPSQTLDNLSRQSALKAGIAMTLAESLSYLEQRDDNEALSLAAEIADSLEALDQI